MLQRYEEFFNYTRLKCIVPFCFMLNKKVYTPLCSTNLFNISTIKLIAALKKTKTGRKSDTDLIKAIFLLLETILSLHPQNETLHYQEEKPSSWQPFSRKIYGWSKFSGLRLLFEELDFERIKVLGYIEDNKC